MRLKAAVIFCLLAGLAIAVSGLAQEGHPLTGVWYGDAVTGIVNPGSDWFPLKVVTLDSSKWTVHIEADGKDDKGAPAHFVADGKLENIGSYNRTITGTWNYGTNKATFKLRRD